MFVVHHTAVVKHLACTQETSRLQGRALLVSHAALAWSLVLVGENVREMQASCMCTIVILCPVAICSVFLPWKVFTCIRPVAIYCLLVHDLEKFIQIRVPQQNSLAISEALLVVAAVKWCLWLVWLFATSVAYVYMYKR